MIHYNVGKRPKTGIKVQKSLREICIGVYMGMSNWNRPQGQNPVQRPKSAQEQAREALSEYLRALRLLNGMTMTSAAENAGVDMRTIRKAESGENLTVDKLLALLEGYGALPEFVTNLKSGQIFSERLLERFYAENGIRRD